MRLIAIIGLIALLFISPVHVSSQDNIESTQKAEQAENDKQIAALVKRLNEEDQAKRKKIEYEIKKMGEQAVPALVRALRSNNVTIRRAAASLLGYRDRRLLEPLINAIYDEDAVVRANAALSLASINDPVIIKPLVQASNDPDERVRAMAVMAADKIIYSVRFEIYDAALKDSSAIVRKTAISLWPKYNRPVAELIAFLRDSSPAVREAAIKELSKYDSNPDIIEPVIPLVTDESDAVRGFAVYILVTHNKRKQYASVINNALIKALDEENFERWKTASRALLDSVPEMITPPKAALSGRRVDDWDAISIAVIAGARDPRYFDLLLIAIKDFRDHTRARAAEALGKFKDKRAVEPLKETAKDSYSNVVISAINALKEIDETEAEPLFLDKYNELLTRLDSSEENMRRFASKKNTRRFEMEEEDTRRYAVESLADMKDARIVEPVIKMLGDKKPKVRYAAYDALGKIGCPDCIAALVKALKGADLRHAARALAKTRTKDPAVVKPLMDVMGNDDINYEYDLRQYIISIGAPAVEPLIPFLKHKDGKARYASANMLAGIKSPAAIEPLAALLKNEHSEEIKNEAAKALAEIGGRAISALAGGLEDTDPKIRNNIAKLLGRSGDAGAVEPLQRLLSADPVEYVRDSAIRALGELKDPRAIGNLIEHFLKSPSSYTVISALTNIGSPAIEFMYPHIKSADSHIRKGAVGFFAALNDPQFLHVFSDALNDHDIDVQKAALSGLRNIKHDSRVIEPLSSALKNSAPEIRATAIEILHFVKNKDNARQLTRIFQDALLDEDSQVRIHAIKGLTDTNDPSLMPLLIDALENIDTTVVTHAAMALGETGDTSATPYLIRLLYSTRISGICALAVLGDHRALDPLTALLKDTDKEVMSLAQAAIYSIKNNGNRLEYIREKCR